MVAQSPVDSRTQDSLVAAGWRRRAMLSAERLAEVEAIYRELGLEVLVVKPDPARFEVKCHPCSERACLEYRVIFTREKRS